MDSDLPPAEPGVPPTPPVSIPIKRPLSVTILTLGVLIIAVINLTRFILSLREWGFLASRSGVSPLYLAFSGLVWCLAGAFLIWGLWAARPWAPRLMQAGGLTYALYYWLDLLFLQDHPVTGVGGVLKMVLPTNWQFSALVTIICLAYMAWTLSRSKVKAYFGQVHEKSNVSQGEGLQG